MENTEIKNNNDDKKDFQSRKKQYNKEYYLKVRKTIQKIERCKIYNIPYNENEPITIIIEKGPFYVSL